MILIFFIAVFFAVYHTALAHEAYVLAHDVFWKGIKEPYSAHAFDALKDPHNIHLTIIIVLGIAIFFGLNFFFRRSQLGSRLHSFLDRYARFGPLIVRYTIAAALFFSASSQSFLGPELYGNMFPYPHLLQITLFAISIMIALGLFTELAASIGIFIFILSFFIFGSYMLTYFNYLGELIILTLLGMRVFSLDKYIFGPLRRFKFMEKYETIILRVFYGFALIYAGLAVKFLHPELTISVIQNWHLTKFHWLFPSDPLLVTLGGGLAEILIGFFIIIGFELRMTVLISLFYITMSLLYFRELVWPHLLLYGISFSLILQPEVFTIDHILFKKHRDKIHWWLRPLLPHKKFFNL